jgi:hypothetical protein
MTFPLEQVCRVGTLHGDHAALGGAVTVALCGHWEHEPPCRWPHHTASRPDPDEDGSYVVTVRFDAGPADEGVVRERIRAALAIGRLRGPDGATTTWVLRDSVEGS